MINKTNNISFKRVIIDDSIVKMKPQNITKLELTSQLCQEFFPKNDVFLMSNDEGELVYQVQRSNPLFHLLDPDILEKAGLAIEEMGALINASTAMKEFNNALYDKKQESLRDCTDNIDKLDSMEIAYQIKDTINEFNELYPEDIN